MFDKFVSQSRLLEQVGERRYLHHRQLARYTTQRLWPQLGSMEESMDS